MVVHAKPQGRKEETYLSADGRSERANTMVIANWSTTTAAALRKITTSPARRLPNRCETKPTSELTAAAPQVPETKIGAACRTAPAPKIFVNRAMFVGKMAELP